MRLHLVTLVSLLLVGLSSPDLLAQERVQPGQRLRITYDCVTRTPVTRQVTASCRRQDGKLLEVRGDSITLAVGDQGITYRLADLARLELSRGRRSRWLVGGLVGSAVGGVTAFVLLNSGGHNSLCDQSQNQDASDFEACLGMSALFGALPGFGLGALVGAVAKSERWEEVPVDRLRLSVAPGTAAPFRLAITLDF